MYPAIQSPNTTKGGQVDESQRTDAAGDPGSGDPGTPTEISKRLAGVHRALTSTIQERDAAAARAEAAEARLATLEAERDAARLDLRRTELEMKYPAALDALGDRADFDDEDFLARMEDRLKGPSDPAPREARIDANNPRKMSYLPPSVDDMSADALVDSLKAQGNPWTEKIGWGR